MPDDPNILDRSEVKYIGVAGATGAPTFQVQKSSSPVNYDNAAFNSPAMLLQWSDDEDHGLNFTADSFLFRTDVTGDGYVVQNESLSGGSSYTVWRGLTSLTNKTGDGSAHSFSGRGTLNAVGATGYNELGGYIGSFINAGSILGTVHATELIAADGYSTVQNSGTAQAGSASSITLASGASSTTDAYVPWAVKTTGGTGSGQMRRITAYDGSTKVATVTPDWDTNPDATTTYQVIRCFDTYLVGHLSRVQKFFNGSRKSFGFALSSEGAYATSAVLAVLPNPVGVETGVDFSEVNFTTGNAGLFANGDALAWLDSGGEPLKLIRLNSSDQLEINVGGAGLAVVSVGANDSGGTGYKLLRIPN